MLTLITWLIQYLSDFSTINLYSSSTLYGVLFGRLSLTTALPWRMESYLCSVSISVGLQYPLQFLEFFYKEYKSVLSHLIIIYISKYLY